jgi:hypothetical protein
VTRLKDAAENGNGPPLRSRTTRPVGAPPGHKVLGGLLTSGLRSSFATRQPSLQHDEIAHRLIPMESKNCVSKNC